MEIDFSKQIYNKFKGTAPEGMVLVPEELLEEIKNFEVWMEFKYGGQKWIERRSSEILSKEK